MCFFPIPYSPSEELTTLREYHNFPHGRLRFFFLNFNVRFMILTAIRPIRTCFSNTLNYSLMRSAPHIVNLPAISTGVKSVDTFYILPPLP